jgi:phosphatidate cytidylyltransferase
VIIGAICFHPYAYLAVFTLIVGLALWEFYGLVGYEKPKRYHTLIGITGGIYFFVASFFYAKGCVSGCIFSPYIGFLIILLIAGLYHKSANPVNDWGMALFAQFYCVGLLSFLNLIAFNPSTHLYVPHFVMSIFILVWVNDTGAYLVGSNFGKRRLFPRISPRKSWEGFWGGFALALGASQLFAHFFPQIIWYHWLGLTIVTVVIGTWGDLVESLIKRTYGAKDSGSLLPGHGGILDRFDSVILAAPAVYLYIELFIRN